MKLEYYGWDDGTSLYHYGIPGQKWGVRRWQNADGSFNDEGKKRYFGSVPDKKHLISDAAKEWDRAGDNYRKKLNDYRARHPRSQKVPNDVHKKIAKELDNDRKSIIDRLVTNYVDNYGPLLYSSKTDWIIEAFEDNNTYVLTTLDNGKSAIVRR